MYWHHIHIADYLSSFAYRVTITIMPQLHGWGSNWSKISGVFKWPSQIQVNAVPHFFGQIPKKMVYWFLTGEEWPYLQIWHFSASWHSTISLQKLSINIDISLMIVFPKIKLRYFVVQMNSLTNWNFICSDIHSEQGFICSYYLYEASMIQYRCLVESHLLTHRRVRLFTATLSDANDTPEANYFKSSGYKRMMQYFVSCR